MIPPQVSVIIPIYNGEADLPPLLECLWAQTDGPTVGPTAAAPTVEYLLVDNHSRDRSWDLLQAAQAEAAGRGLTLIPLAENQIQSSYAARNRAIHQARGQWLVFTDADCRPDPAWLREFAAAFAAADDRLGLIAGEIVALPGTSLWERFADRYHLLSQRHTLAHPFLPYGQTANLAVRRAVFEQVGLFRPYLTTGGDADFCWRVQRETDWQISLAAGAIVRHRHRASREEFVAQLARYGRSNRYLHDLHGIPLMKPRDRLSSARRWLRWLLKEVPPLAVKRVLGRASLLDLLATPMDLIGAAARWRGQANARLSDQAREIEYLPPVGTDPDVTHSPRL